MLKLGLCCGSGLCCALLSGVLWSGIGTSVINDVADVVTEKTVGCTKTGCARTGCEEHATAGAPCGMLGGDATMSVGRGGTISLSIA